MRSVCVVTPTLNRPGPLRRALLSLQAQTGLEGRNLEIVVVDNSPNQSAAAALQDLGALKFPTRMVAARSTGVANARNAGVAAARADWIAFLDDDEEADPQWLSQMLRVAEAAGADAAFGPIAAKGEDGAEVGELAPYFARALPRPDGADISDLAAYVGCNNSLFDRARCLSGAGPFDVRLNQSGGEDSLLLQQLVLDGRRLAYAAEGKVIEWVPAARLNWAYVRRRRFLSGQIRVFVQTMTRPKRWHAALGWMAVGAMQALLWGVAAFALRLLSDARRNRALAALQGGLGKVFWRQSWRPKLYGEGHVS